MRRLLKRIVILLLIFGASSNVYAQNIQFTATVDSTKVALGSVVQLTLTLKGAQIDSVPEIPDIEGFEARYIGPSTRISIINGRYSRSVSYIYNLFPLKEGQWTIPSVKIDVKGRTFETEPIDIEVVAQGSSAQKQQQRSDISPSGIEDRLFLTLEVPKNKVYLYEKIPVTLKLYITDLSVRDIQYPELEKMGFTMDDFEEPKQYSQIVGGVRYNVVEFNTSIYPTRVGEITIGPARLNCSILYKKERRRQSFFGDFDSFFDDDFFDSFFDSYGRYPYTVESAYLSLQVSSLPQENQPKGFSGAVGQFNFEVSVSPQEVTEGDPITLRMKLSGQGNLNNVAMPVLSDSEQIKTYEPNVKQENGIKVLEQVVIPKSSAVKQLPAISFSYFDTEEGQYKTITRGPFPLKVKKSTVERQTIIAPPQKENAALQEVLGRDIVFIKEDPGRFVKKGFPFYSSRGFYASFILITICFGMLNVFIWHKEKIKSDAQYAQRLLAPKKAKSGMRAAKQCINQNQVSSFYDAIFKTLQEYFSGKFHIPPGAITMEAVKEKVRDKRPDENVLRQLKDIFNTCDAIRYASLTREKKEMEEDLKKTEKIIDYFERLG